ncbi:MAG: hypothetical protein DBX42_03430 [Azospirillum sp.]|nr:MAG: hypothetical protein DBX42_03430 [Azospirillum sp.]
MFSILRLTLLAALSSLPILAFGGRLVISEILTLFKSTIIGTWLSVVLLCQNSGISTIISRKTTKCRASDLYKDCFIGYFFFLPL